MLVTYSPLIAQLRGKAADAVASSWKGRSYIRKHVIPRNPQSAAQTLVRESFAACIPLWRSLPYQFKTFLDTYGTGYQMSGMNVFVQKCRVLEQADALIKPVPDSPVQAAPDTLAFATGAGAAGTIDATWVDNSGATYNNIWFCCRLAGTNIFQVVQADDSNGSPYTITGLADGETYDCYGAFEDGAANIFGSSDGDLAVDAKA